MSTAVATPPSVTTGKTIHHTITWGRFTWVCKQDKCDGQHHFWCSCSRTA